ncbi:DUF4383 domain-containing protein [Streptomyces sp. ISL-43]|uniref:DUF4383 domain-containing protein n=1 Tax=Streptomyces sp. ISL-43 TaxID=2819183 RepID=UPI001BEA43E3|nr:DUF4383 domain-containing protein [Streptomyces sp. ISL-43]MBT2452788.1 DUF4383 domain-containing protein [Streptomyces sp. ISL-43]
MSPRSRPAAAPGSLVQWAALLIGAAFLVAGVLGMIPGPTTNYDAMTFAGHDSGAELFGLFQVSVLHNIVHLIFGLAGIALSRTPGTARTYLIGGGAVYLVLWLYGLLVDRGTDANFIPVNTADNWLHFGLGLAMVVLGLILGRTPPVPRRGRG